VLNAHTPVAEPSLDDVLAAETDARAAAREAIGAAA
jgi:hypothetical protein